MVGTQVIYQTALNALFFNQPLSTFQYYGLTVGVFATIVISAGDEIKDYLNGKEQPSKIQEDAIDHTEELLKPNTQASEEVK